VIAAQLFNHGGQFAGQRAGNVQPAAGQGMRETQARGVEKKPAQTIAVAEDTVVFTLAVVHVADERAGNVLEVAAHLVQSAGARAGLDEAVAAEYFPTQILSLGADPRGVAIFTGRQGMVDESRAGRNAAHQGQIGLLYRVGGERLAQAGRDLGRESEQQDAAGGAVQAMHRKHVYAQLVSHTHHGHIAFARPSPMNGKARGFVHRDQRLVTKENWQRA